MSEPEVQDARGLVLSKNGWSVLSLAFRKFFNVGEGNGAPIDWSTVRVFEKLDGTLIHVYSDRTGIHFGTTDTAEGEGSVENWSPDGGTKQSFGTFADLFWKAFLETNIAYYKENPKSMYRIVEDGKHFDDEGNPAGPYMQDKPPIYDNRAQAFAWWSGYTLAFELCTPYHSGNPAFRFPRILARREEPVHHGRGWVPGSAEDCERAWRVHAEDVRDNRPR